MTDNINKKTTDNSAATDDKANTTNDVYQSNAFPTMPTIDSDSPWLSAYERYSIDATIEMPEDNTSLLPISAWAHRLLLSN